MIDKLLFIDTEATGVDEADRIVQVAYNCKDEDEYRVTAFFKPPVPIKPGAMAIHHITEKRVADEPPFEGSGTKKHLLELSDKDYIFVAHNAPYDLGMLKKEGIEFKKSIDTLKIAKHIDDGQFENHQLQYLRYFYGLEVDLGILAPHDAFADIIVLEQVFWQLARELAHKEGLFAQGVDDEAVVKRMVEITANPLLLKICGMKKHKGKTWEEVARIDRQYLEWNLTRDDLGEDERHTINYWLNK